MLESSDFILEVRQSSRPPEIGLWVETISVSENIILRGIQKTSSFIDFWTMKDLVPGKFAGYRLPQPE